jgi:hypothetical protein
MSQKEILNHRLHKTGTENEWHLDLSSKAMKQRLQAVDQAKEAL